jgi:uncharacterized DUF497 family protein
MAFEFEWDPAKARANFAKHGVSFAEAMTIFGDPLSSTFSDPDHSLEEERLVILGMSHRGRLLAVMHTERRRASDGAAIIRIFSAREATRGERMAYEEDTP